MSQAGIRVDLKLREIHALVCKKCKEKLRKLVRDKISEQLVDQVIGEEATA